MKDRKGFTLVELLAVLAILAVIVVIAVPIIGNVINDSKLSSAQSSANGLISAAEVLYGNRMLEDPYYTGEKITFGNDSFVTTFVASSSQTFEYNGKLPTSGELLIENEVITLTDIYFENNGAICNGTKGNVTCVAETI